MAGHLLTCLHQTAGADQVPHYKFHYYLNYLVLDLDYGTLYSHLVSQNVKHVVDGNCKDVLTWLVGRVSGLLPVLELCLGTRGMI